MRNFIKDAFLHWMLCEIEGWLGYTISASPLAESLHSTHAARVGRLDGKWHFQCNPSAPPSQFIMLHELMHVVLHIEGWPIWATHNSIMMDTLLDELYCRIINFPQHVIINDRMHILKSVILDEQTQAKGSIGDSEKNQERDYPVFRQEISIQTKIDALVAAEIMLSPHGILPDNIDRAVLQRDDPQCWILADSICREVERHRPLHRESGVDLLYKILETLSLTKENLRPLPSGTRYHPQCFDRILAKLCQ